MASTRSTWIPIEQAKPGDPISSAKFNEQGLGNLEYLHGQYIAQGNDIGALTTRVATVEQVDAPAATGSLRTLGTGPQQAAAGNDSRIADAALKSQINVFTQNNQFAAGVEVGQLVGTGPVFQLGLEPGVGLHVTCVRKDGGAAGPGVATFQESGTAQFNGLVVAEGTLYLRERTLAATPSTFMGALATITDSTTTVMGSVVTGGGTNSVLARWDGTVWRVVGSTAFDYTEGTWTPTLTADGGASGQSYGANTAGSYIKIGRLVHVTGTVELTAKGTLTGTVQLAGLPFPVGGVTASGLHVNYWYALTAAYTDLTLQLIFGSQKGYLRGNTAPAASQGAVAGSAISDIFQLGFNGTYQTT